MTTASVLHELAGRDSSFNRVMEYSQVPAALVVLSALACRLCIRWWRAGLGLDDLAIFIAGCCTAFACAVGMVWFTNPNANEPQATRWFIIIIFQSYVNIFFIRLSIGLFLLRILVANSPHQSLRYLVYLCLVLNLAITAALLGLVGGSCRPLRATWDHSIPAQCLPFVNLNIGVKVLAACSAAVDALYGIIPMVIFWKLNLPLKRKLNLLFLVSLAFVICVCAIGKTVTLKADSPDFASANKASYVWGTLEYDLGIIVACLPGLRQFYVAMRQKLSRLRRSRRSNSSSEGPVDDKQGAPRSHTYDAAEPRQCTEAGGRSADAAAVAASTAVKTSNISIRCDTLMEKTLKNVDHDVNYLQENEPYSRRPSEAPRRMSTVDSGSPIETEPAFYA